MSLSSRKQNPFGLLRSTKTSVDSDLVGTWEYTAFGRQFLLKITADGKWIQINEADFEISSDGATLKSPLSDSVTFNRVYGSGTTIVGVWNREYVLDDFVEEIYYRQNQTYVAQWFSSGVFDSEFIGEYSTTGNKLNTEELSGFVETDASSNLTLHTTFGPTSTATYVVAAGGNGWTMTAGGVSTVFTKI